MKKIILKIKRLLSCIISYKVETYQDVENLYNDLASKCNSLISDFQWSCSKEMIDNSYYLTADGWRQGKDLF